MNSFKICVNDCRYIIQKNKTFEKIKLWIKYPIMFYPLWDDDFDINYSNDIVEMNKYPEIWIHMRHPYNDYQLGERIAIVSALKIEDADIEDVNIEKNWKPIIEEVEA